MKFQKDTWKFDLIGNVCQVISGGTPGRNVQEYFGGDISWFTPTEIPKEKIEVLIDSKENISELGLRKSSAKILPKGTVLLTSRATIGLIAVAGKDLTTNQGFANFICDDNILNNWYLAFWLHSKVDLIKSLSSGTTFKEISKSTIRKLEIPLPPVEEQRKIAVLFQYIEKVIDLVKQQERNLQSLQKSLVNGLLKPKPTFGTLLYNENCTLTTFGAIAECDKRYPEHKNEVSRFIGLENIEPESFQLNGHGEISHGTTFTKRFSKGDVLFGKRRAYLKKVAIAGFDGICSGDILVIRTKSNQMLQGLLPFYISADAFIQHAVSTSAGSLSPRTKWKDLAELKIVIPDMKSQEKILVVLQQLQTSVQQLKQQKSTLITLKQKLLNEILG